MQEKIKKFKTYGQIKRVQNNDISNLFVKHQRFLLALLGLTTKCETSMVLDNLIKKQ